MLEPSGMALAEETDFRDIGTYPVYPYPHPETITLPRYLKGVRRVTNRGSVLPIEYFHKIMDVIRLGLGSEEKLVVRGQEVSTRQFAVAFVLAQREKMLKKAGICGPQGCLKVQVQGSKDGQPHTYIFSMTSRTGGVGEGTGIPAALGAMLMGQGRIDKKGVFPPEAVVNPVEVLKLTGKIVARFGPAGKLPFVLEHIGPDGKREDIDLRPWF
jgi:saccharopine dehydrogenase (NAD+, L-lysine-forming)